MKTIGDIVKIEFVGKMKIKAVFSISKNKYDTKFSRSIYNKKVTNCNDKWFYMNIYNIVVVLLEIVVNIMILVFFYKNIYKSFSLCYNFYEG